MLFFVCLFQVFLIFASIQTLKKQCTHYGNRPNSSPPFIHQLHLYTAADSNKCCADWSDNGQAPEDRFTVRQGWDKAGMRHYGMEEMHFPH